MALELAGAIAIGALTSVVTWLLRRHAWNVAYWIGASLLALIVVTVVTLALWVATGGGREGECFPVGPVLLVVASGTAVSWSLNSALVGATQAKSVGRPFFQVFVSGYLDCAIGLLLSLYWLSNFPTRNDLWPGIASESGWLATLVWIRVTKQQGQAEAE